jgi:hypothetical protein
LILAVSRFFNPPSVRARYHPFMKPEFTRAAVFAASLFAATSPAHAQIAQPTVPTKGTPMTSQATGTFEVKVKPLPEDEKVPGVAVGRMSIDKTFKGDIDGTSKGEMMTAGTQVKGSAGYVAVEIVTASIKGRSGTFTLLHHATMKQEGDFRMNIVVIPDSGTGDLVGLTGKMEIIIEAGKHSYKFDYTLPV